jgi:hypothetical protein
MVPGNDTKPWDFLVICHPKGINPITGPILTRIFLLATDFGENFLKCLDPLAGGAVLIDVNLF